MTILFALGMLVFQIILAAILPQFQQELPKILEQLKFVQYILAALLGTDPEVPITTVAFSAMPWAHPFVLALAWAHAILYCSRVPAGEIDRGTIDVVLAFPVSRWAVYLSETTVWLASGAIIVATGVIGHFLGGIWLENDHPMAFDELLAVNVNLLGVYFAVGGVARLFSSISNRRGRAAGAAFAVVLASFIVNTLATFNETIGHFSFLGILTYYRPLSIIGRGAWPMGDLAVLIGVGATLWLAGGIIFAHRDLRTV